MFFWDSNAVLISMAIFLSFQNLQVLHWQNLNPQWFELGPGEHGHGGPLGRPPLHRRVHKESLSQWLQQWV